jgi:pre-mRNA-processing factor 19
MEVDNPEAAPAPVAIPAAVIEKMAEKQKELSKGRRKRAIPETWATADGLKGYTVRGSYPIHKASAPGILCVDAHPTKPLVITGGADTDVVVFSTDRQRVSSVLSGHTKRVSAVSFHPTEELALSSSVDRTVRVWSAEGGASEYRTVQTLRVHEGEVTSMSVQPTGDYLATSSTDRSWALWDIRTGALLVRIRDLQASPAPLRSVRFHPDGILLATGSTDSVVRIWELGTSPRLGAVLEGHKGPITDISFSQNGYMLATASEDCTVRLWDLRKTATLQTLSLSTTGKAVTSVCFDQTAQFLAASAGSDIQVFSGKQLTPLQTFSSHTNTVTGVAFGPNASFIASASLDRNLKIFASPSDV